MAAARIALLTVGLGLQVWLLVLLFRRRAAAQVMLFPGLLGFYTVRSAILFVLFPSISRTVYASLYSAFSVLDIGLQIAVAVELWWMMASRARRSRMSRTLSTVMLLLFSVALTGALVMVLPARSPVPADRGTLFTGFLFLLLLASSVRVEMTSWAKSVLAGLAIIGASGIVSQSAKAIAAMHHRASWFSFWSYENAMVYLLVLLAWIASYQAASVKREIPAAGEPVGGMAAVLRG